MKILRHKIEGMDFIPTKNQGGKIVPKFIIMHYTAGWSLQSTIDAFKNRKVSAQFIVDRDGSAVQMVACNRRAWHAGPSRFHGYKNMNSHSIGIELVNIGFFRRLSGEKWQDPYGGVHDYEGLIEKGYHADQMVEAKNARLGSGDFYWPLYTEAQLDTLDFLVKALVKAYDIEDIGSHEEIDTRGWKTDPGAAFPMKRFKALLTGDDRNVAEDKPYRVRVTTDKLNVRSGAGSEWNAFGHLDKDMTRTVIGQDGKWLLLHLGGQAGQGWVHSYYTERI